MEEGEGKLHLWKSDSVPKSMVSVTVGRVMTTLLGARPKKLYDAVSHLSPDHRHGVSSIDSLDESLWFLHKYVMDAAQNHASLEEILVPIIEHTLRFKDKDWKRGGQVMILLNWMFLDEIIFHSLVKNLADIIVRKDDRYVALGWCILVRGLVEYESRANQFSLIGFKNRFSDMLKIFCSCIPRLTCILSKGSYLQEGFELPSRLSVCASDCVVSLTNALTKKAEVQTRHKLHSSSPNQQVTLFSTAASDKRVKPISKSSKDSDTDRECLLWHQLEGLVILVERLLAWSRKSRPLHAKGLERVHKWLLELNVHYGKEGSKILKTGALLLSSCWKHYSMLLFLEDHRFSLHYQEWLNQYLSGIQYYSGHHTGESTSNKDGQETTKFFMNCLCLLLGRLDSRKFESTVSEYGTQISQILLLQFQCTDDDIIDVVVNIFKEVFLNPNLSSGSSVPNIRQLDIVMPSLLNLLDERDGTARAVTILIAEYCLMSRDSQFLPEVFKRFDSDSIIQRRNAIDVVSEIVRMSSNTEKSLTRSACQDIASHLLKCLEDEEILICKQASDLLSYMDPSLVLPSLVRLVYTSNERVFTSAGEALIGLLKCHNQNVEAIYTLLDCLSDFSQKIVLPNTADVDQAGSRLQSDRVLRLIPEWSQSVQDWKFLIGPLIDKMFAEPSNAIIVRFLSTINEHLVKAIDVVLNRILSYVKRQKEIDESFYVKWESQNFKSDVYLNAQQSLFERLCPLLIIRMLPLEVFNDLNLSIMYGQLPDRAIMYDMHIVDPSCVAALLLNRAFSKFEFDEVRKLASELCGRIHPRVLYPFVISMLKDAAASHNTRGIKACLYSVCTSLVVRGKDTLSHLNMFDIARTLEVVLSWPSQDENEVSRSQHGCIDCMALMICTELQSPNSFSDSNWENIDIGHTTSKISILGYVIHHLTHGRNELISAYDVDNNNNAFEDPTPVSFRLCMANVLISACQKLADSQHNFFAQKALPHLICYVEASTQLDVRAACLQVLFSAVYHLKSAVLPYAHDLFRVSLNCLKSGSEKERIASAKLMVSLMSSEDAILESISGGLLEARAVLSSVSSSDSSIEVQQICAKMLRCLLSS